MNSSLLLVILLVVGIVHSEGTQPEPQPTVPLVDAPAPAAAPAPARSFLSHIQLKNAHGPALIHLDASPLVKLQPAAPIASTNEDTPPPVPARVLELSSIVQKLPLFIKSIFEGQQNAIGDKLGQMRPKSGFISILLMKSNHQQQQQDQANKEQGEHIVDFRPLIVHKQQQMILGGPSDTAEHQFFEQKTNDEQSPLLLPPQTFFDFFKNSGFKKDSSSSEEEEEDVKEGEESKNEPTFILKNKSQMEEDQLIAEQERLENAKSYLSSKCMMEQLRRLRASIYYRTLVHLVFMSALLLFTLLMVIMTMRLCRKRQQQMTLYTLKSSGKQEISSIRVDAAGEEKRMAGAPPAYEQLSEEQEEARSAVKFKRPAGMLGQAQNKYSILIDNQRGEDHEEDRKSLSSLPEYEEHEQKKQEQI